MNETKPLISVIVPVYNVEKYLSRCIESILNQDFTDFELILVDDGSSDSCGTIIDKYGQRDSRIKCIHQKNQGLSGARNTGIDQSCGQYITFIDSDDYVSSSTLKIMYNLILKEGSDIAIVGYERVYDSNYCFPQDINNYNVKTFDNKEALRLLCEGKMNFVIACGKLYSRKLWEELRFPLGKLNEDTFVQHWLFYNAKKITYMNIPLYAYFFRNDSIMASESKSIKYKDCLEAYIDRLNLLFSLKNQTNNIINTINLFWWWYFWKIPQDLSYKELNDLFKDLKMRKIIFIYYILRDKKRNVKERILLSCLILSPYIYLKLK